MFLILDCFLSHFGLNFASHNSTVKLHSVMVGRLNTHVMAISGPSRLDHCCPVEKINIKNCGIVLCIFYLYLQRFSGNSIVSKSEIIKIMKKQKLFQCDICDKRFGQKLYLKVQRRTHYTV